jgi:zinc transport system substrate-binding protein
MVFGLQFSRNNPFIRENVMVCERYLVSIERLAMPRSVLKILAIVTLSLTYSQFVLARDTLPVFVSIVPQKYFVQQIGKELVDIHVMVLPGASPATYEPKPKQMVAISKTKVYFSVGVPFEKVWLKKIISMNPNMWVVPTDQEIQKIPMATSYPRGRKEHHEKGGQQKKADHGYGEDHPEYGTLDPHIWLSPPLVMMQARRILTALQEADPTHRSTYEANYKTFISDIRDLDVDLRNIFAGKRDLQFMVFHPAWGYFAHTYGLKQVPVEIEGKKPKPAQLKELIKHAKENNIKVVFVQPQFSSKSAEQVAKEIDGQVVFVDPLALNWSENLRKVANKFNAALR